MILRKKLKPYTKKKSLRKLAFFFKTYAPLLSWRTSKNSFESSKDDGGSIMMKAGRFEVMERDEIV